MPYAGVPRTRMSSRTLIAEIDRTFRETIKESLVPRDELLAALTNRELAFRPSSANPTLGELCLRIGETQHSYAASFRTFAADFEYRYHDASIAGDIERLRNWHAELDAELEAALESLSQNDASRTIARDGERVPLATHLLVFNEALLLFFGKAFVYLKAGRMAMPKKWGAWVE